MLDRPGQRAGMATTSSRWPLDASDTGLLRRPCKARRPATRSAAVRSTRPCAAGLLAVHRIGRVERAGARVEPAVLQVDHAVGDRAPVQPRDAGDVEQALAERVARQRLHRVGGDRADRSPGRVERVDDRQRRARRAGNRAETEPRIPEIGEEHAARFVRDRPQPAKCVDVPREGPRSPRDAEAVLVVADRDGPFSLAHADGSSVTATQDVPRAARRLYDVRCGPETHTFSRPSPCRCRRRCVLAVVAHLTPSISTTSRIQR